MNLETFQVLLQNLAEAQWQAVLDGKTIIIKNDRELLVGEENELGVIIPSAEKQVGSALELKQETLKSAESLLQNYYRSHPLSREGFDTQLQQLSEQHGLLCFAGTQEKMPDYTLFVEGGELLAEDESSPRFRYGAFCELEEPDIALAEKRVQEWIQSGEAYENYLSMNVCRYSC